MKSVKEKLIEEIGTLIKTHHKYAPCNFSDTKNYLAGCVFVMDDKSAQSMSLDKLIADGYPHPKFISNFLDIFIKEDDLKNVPDVKEQAKAIKEHIESELLFYRFKDSSNFKVIDDALNAINEFSFWLPMFIMLNGVWHNTCDIGAKNANRNTIGIRV